MLLDLHVHSDASDDSRAPVEAYLSWIKKRGATCPLDGFVLTEHRHFDFERDLRALEDRHQIRIFRGAEIETDYGHVLVFGVTREMTRHIDFSDVRLPAQRVVTEVARMGGAVVPCHPGRPTVGLWAHYQTKPALEGLVAIETLNGGSRKGEDERAEDLLKRYHLRGTGGSDAHMVSFIGRCATEFERPLRDEEDLVEALTREAFRAVDLRDGLAAKPAAGGARGA